MDRPAKPRDVLVALACGLAVALMVFPFQGGLLFGLLREGRFGVTVVVAALCSTIVAVPTARLRRRHLHEPPGWRGRACLAVARAILTLDTALIGIGLAQALLGQAS